ncbi:multicopper oxidase family protein [Acinetobacter sp. ANC 5414]|uniref:multicopper oxidase family protein n=1 Tax=Acinetobacter sp. ANC 5414 TaxID=2731251 RepID=UPI0033184829
MAYKLNKLYNPNTKLWDPVFLRGYLTKPSLFDKKKAYAEDILVGPQIRVKQGETLQINLNNQLPLESEESCPHDIADVNVPHCFNTTNIHTHGLWVSPQGNSDNVFLKFTPQEKFDYQYKIEPNHPAGTYWYHAHLHGSTAIQVSSGMAGPLIVEGSRVPKIKNGKITETGDMDILWKDKTKNSTQNENILLFQQIQYKKCTQSDNASCVPGTLEDYVGLANPGSWGAGEYYTSINGKILGEMKAEQNQFNRWRMIHGGVRDTIGLMIKELPNSNKYTAEQTIKACSEYQTNEKKAEFTKLKSLTVHTIAQDGLTMNQAQSRTLSVFHPGYRQDAMVAFPNTNKYCIFDTKLNVDDQINVPLSTGQITPQLAPSNPLNAQLIGWVNVSASKSKQQTAAQFLKNQAQNMGLSKEIQTQLSQLNLAAFTDHESLMTTEVDKAIENRPKQFNAFILAFGGPGGVKFGFRHDEKDLTPISFADLYNGPGSINGHYVRQLQIGQTDEWELTSDNIGIGHPFHIHVNPFQIVKILDLNGKDVSGLAPDPDNPVNLDDVQYRGLKGQFKDTIFVKGGYRVILRSKYKKFEGDFVQHCHILDHEDLGMMEFVRLCGNKFDCNTPPPAHH